MEPTQLLSYSALLCATIVVARQGRQPEKLGLLLVIAMWLATPMVQNKTDWLSRQPMMFAIDATGLTAFAVLGYCTSALWPLCTVAFQGVTVALYVPFWFWPAELYRAFYYANAAMGYLVIGSLIGGCLVEVGQRRSAVQRSR